MPSGRAAGECSGELGAPVAAVGGVATGFWPPPEVLGPLLSRFPRCFGGFRGGRDQQGAEDRRAWTETTPTCHGPAAAQVAPFQCTPSTLRRLQLSAAARVSTSVEIRVLPRTRALRPPHSLDTKWPILRSTLGRVPV